MLKNLLLTEKWRPKSFEDLILPPRLKEIFKNGLDQNIILYGSYGIGKTTLARILIGKWTKNKPFIEINSSYYTSIETLRTKIYDFCTKVYMGFDLDDNFDNTYKYVFLDEFERTSIQYQDALKAYIEEFSSKNVRFILTTNHLNEISVGIRSRFVSINFDAINKEEEKLIKIEIYKKLTEKIIPEEGIKIEKDDLVKIINKKYPDIRNILVELEYFKHTGRGSESSCNIDSKLKEDTFKLTLDKNLEYEEIFNFIMDNYGQDKIKQLLDLFSQDFIKKCIELRIESRKIFLFNSFLAESMNSLKNEIDPIVVAMSFIGKVRTELFN